MKLLPTQDGLTFEVVKKAVEQKWFNICPGHHLYQKQRASPPAPCHPLTQTRLKPVIDAQNSEMEGPDNWKQMSRMPVADCVKRWFIDTLREAIPPCRWSGPRCIIVDTAFQEMPFRCNFIYCFSFKRCPFHPFANSYQLHFSYYSTRENSLSKRVSDYHM